MKKTFLTLFLMTTMFGAAYADGREKPTSVDKLPQAAQEFLSAHFKGSHGGICRRGAEIHGQGVRGGLHRPYGDRIPQRRAVGKASGANTAPVPASIVPQPIQTFVSGSNYPGQFIRQIDRNAYTWEVELSNGFGDQIRQSIQRYRHRRLSIEYTNRVIVIAAFGSGVVGHGLRWTKTVGCTPH